jgi:hypothetical protein
MQGKYSPNIPRSSKNKSHKDFIFNALGEVPQRNIFDSPYVQEIMFGDYDEEGFDSYGYSAYDKNGKYVGNGEGIDRNGITETEYLLMEPQEFYLYTDSI